MIHAKVRIAVESCAPLTYADHGEVEEINRLAERLAEQMVKDAPYGITVIVEA